MARRTANSSTRAYVFVSLNLVLLLIFLLSGVENMRNVYKTTSEYDAMLREWFALRLAITDMMPGDAVSSLQQFRDLRESIDRLGSSEFLVASSRLSVDVEQESRLLEAAWRDFVRTTAGPASLSSWETAQERLEILLLSARATISEIVSTQDRALTVLLYCLGATVVIVMVVFVVVEIENERGRRLAAENQLLARNSLESQETERNRIARDLHDSLAQDLSTALLEADLIGGAANPVSRTDASQSLRHRLEHMIMWVRNLAYELRPPEIDAIGLVAALRRYCEERTAATHVRIQFSAPEEPHLADKGMAITAYRVIQEAVTNAIRHAAPSLITVKILGGRDSLEITVTDNGTGGVDHARHASSTGLGIAGMRERARMLGAAFQITSHRDEGTTVRLTIPAGQETQGGYS